ncbi:ATP/GTP-binding protein [Nibricoccus aquaticus]|uniref:ATP/GTP-binding protein n=1 Tax=Nibricoccus aquaticus TaxID=2576891 RepID=A0A290Q8L4_9BACT|nr:ATP/GTP-binding protein [Nibricoccus aquaticus]ATC63520.1 ATP/GTP-binding protein [Nibricoccus aquaticus]
MKNPLIAALALATATALTAADPASSLKLVKLWETEPLLKTPESVLFDSASTQLYVSNIDGKTPWTSDARGSIGKVALDGKILSAEWVTGLDNPKGLGLHAGKLYVADMTHVVVIDVAKAAILEKIAIAGAERLNDITIDSAGIVYVSDSKTGKVHTLTDGKPATLLENLKDVNGLLAQDGILYVLADSSLFERSKDGRLSKIADGMEGGVDGVVKLTDGSFVVSGWQGVIYHVAASGDKTQLLDSRPAIQTADIGGDPATRTIYVPTFFANTVAAYRIE